MAGNRGMVRARCGVRMRICVVSYTLSMCFLPDQYPRRWEKCSLCSEKWSGNKTSLAQSVEEQSGAQSGSKSLELLVQVLSPNTSMCRLALVPDPLHVLGRKGWGSHLVCELDPCKI